MSSLPATNNGDSLTFTTARKWLEVLGSIETAGVIEVCEMAGKGPEVVGYFDNYKDAANAITQLERKNGNVYVTLNPAKPELLARASNRLKQNNFNNKIERTKDHEILADHWFFIDIDPKRASGISSTNDELKAARETGIAVKEWLFQVGIPEHSIVTAQSGNGVYLLIRTYPYPISEEHRDHKRAILNYIADLFQSQAVDIDRSVFNAARLVAAIGTTKRKGDSTEARPHRKSSVGFIGTSRFSLDETYKPEPCDFYTLLLPLVPADLLEASKKKAQQLTGTFTQGFDVRDYLEKLSNERNTGRGYFYYDCPNCGGKQKLHVNQATGAYGCFHSKAGTCNFDSLRKTIRELTGYTTEPKPVKADNQQRQPVKKQIAPTELPQQVQPLDVWGEPVPFEKALLPKFPVNVLPDILRELVEAISFSTQTPPDLAGTLALAAVAICMHGKAKLIVKPGWKEWSTLYAVCAAPSGSRKSAVFDYLMEPMLQFEDTEKKKARPIVEKNRKQRDKLVREQGYAIKMIVHAKDEDQRNREQAKFDDIQRQIDQIKELVEPKIFTEDITPERIIGVLAKHDERIAIFSPEADALQAIAGMYNANGRSSLAPYLKGYDGEFCIVDRQGEQAEGRSYRLRHPSIAIGLAVQTSVIRRLAEEQRFMERGLIQRFLFSLPPDNLGHRELDTADVDDRVLRRYALLVSRLLYLKNPTNGENEKDYFIVRTSQDAKALITNYQREIEELLLDRSVPDGLREWRSKMPGKMARIAMFLMFAELALDDDFEIKLQIRDHHINAAIELARYYSQHAEAAFGVMSSDAGTESARVILEWIENNPKMVFSRRDCYRGLRKHFSSPDSMGASFKLLYQLGYLRQVEESGRGKSGLNYEVNPNWLEFVTREGTEEKQ